MAEFDIIKYMGSLTGYAFERDTLERIALERGVLGVTDYVQLTERERDLIRADMLFVIYTTPTVRGGVTKKHGAWEQSRGADTITDKRHIYELMMRLYRKWDDPNADLVDSGYVQWME